MAEEPDPLIIHIGAREIYDKLIEVSEGVRSLAQTSVSVDEKLDDHESRIRGIERWKYGVPIAALAAIASAFAALYGHG